MRVAKYHFNKVFVRGRCACFSFGNSQEKIRVAFTTIEREHVLVPSSASSGKVVGYDEDHRWGARGIANNLHFRCLYKNGAN